ncbi:hydroxypyruvate isomerase family protein [Rubrivirga sp.]|uniref:hydroxypyruvate isomerase family protein n=1 Tax=Rubrivirga sp. TaxID=1885344 RepID=UPI003C727B69
MRRRDFVRASAALPIAGLEVARGADPSSRTSPRGRASYRHSVTRWPFSDWSLEELCETAVDLGIESVELVQPTDAPVLEAHSLTCAMTAHPPDVPDALRKGWNRTEHHEHLIPAYRRALQAVAEVGWPNLICFSGNRDGLEDAAGLENMARGLEQILPDAERLGVTLCLELFNSKVDHPDYQADSTAWGVALVDRLGSNRFKLLYDIYHMQIMEGDVIRTILDNQGAIAHFHVAGVPGRNNPDETQELFYPAIMRALDEAGFPGFVGQEFVPAGDPRAALEDAVRRCSV